MRVAHPFYQGNRPLRWRWGRKGARDAGQSLTLLRCKGARMGKVSLTLADGRHRKGRREGDKLVFSVPADASLTLNW